MIRIDERSEIPIYLQLINGIKREIMIGVFPPDSRLPSIRDLAVELAVNPNTIAKAFAELEREGVIYMKRGQGAFVAPTSNEQRLAEATTAIRALVAQVRDLAHSMGIERKTLRALIDRELNEPVAHAPVHQARDDET